MRSPQLFGLIPKLQKYKAAYEKKESETKFQTLHFALGGRRDSNPRHPEPQSGALPLNYNHHVFFKTVQR